MAHPRAGIAAIALGTIALGAAILTVQAAGAAEPVVIPPLSAASASAPSASAPAASAPSTSSPAAAGVFAASGVSAASGVPASAPAASAPAATPARPPWIPDIPPIPALNVFDKPRDYVSQEFVNFVSGVDHFFGNDRNYQETNDSVLQLDMTRVMGYTGQHQFVFQGKAKVHLPNTEKRLHLLIESDPDTNAANATRQLQVNQPVANTQTPSSYAAGVRVERQSAEERWHLATDAGLKFAGINTSPFARMRGSYGIPLDDWRMKAAQTFFWFNTTGPGETTQLDFERTISDPLLLRVSSNATWTNTAQQLDLRQDLILFQKVDDRTAMQYQASVIGLSDPRMQSHVTDYVLLMLYRHRLHREWMFLEISPQLHFPQDRSFQSSGMLSVRLEILFDRSR